MNLEGDENFTAADVERMLHARFKPLRLPQTEYFRLSNEDVLECCQIMKSFSEQSHVPIDDFVTYVKEPTTPDQEQTLDEFIHRTDAITEELERADESVDRAWIKDVQERIKQFREEVARFRESEIGHD